MNVMKVVIKTSAWKLFCLILILGACTGKEKSTSSEGGVVGNDSINYSDPLRRDSIHVDSSFRNGLGH